MRLTFAQKTRSRDWLIVSACFLLTVFTSKSLYAMSLLSVPGFGAVAGSILGSFPSVGKLITGGSYITGLAFSIGAIMKFKQHKDNPTQIPIGTPIALVFIAAAFLFLPSILGVTGSTMFTGGGTTAGPEGTNFSGVIN